MPFIIQYTETAEEVAANIAAVESSAGKEYLDLLDCTAAEYVEGWNDLYLCDADKEQWSLGGVEQYEAHAFSTQAEAEAWVAEHGDSEPGTWSILPL